MSDQQKTSATTRRDFMKQAVVVGGALAGGLAIERAAHAGGSDILKVALIGCGGRGRSAAINALRADPKTALTALADIFPDQLEQGRKLLSTQEVSNRVLVGDDHCFTGFDAYKSVMQTDVDVVLLCTPPHFRPAHLRAAIEAGKHVFCEKPVAV